MCQEKEFVSARREHTSILASLEKKVLIWMARRMPARVNSDHLTAFGFLAMLMAGLSFWLARFNSLFLYMVVFWLAINWFGDSLDGTLARVRNRLRPRYGFYVDHICDAFGTLFLFGGLALSGYITLPLGLTLIIAYFLLSIEVFWAAGTLAVFRLSFFKFGPTELRILISTGAITAIYRPYISIFGTPYLLFDVGATIAIAGMFFLSVLSAVQNTKKLYKLETLP